MHTRKCMSSTLSIHQALQIRRGQAWQQYCTERLALRPSGLFTRSLFKKTRQLLWKVRRLAMAHTEVLWLMEKLCPMIARQQGFKQKARVPAPDQVMQCCCTKFWAIRSPIILLRWAGPQSLSAKVYIPHCRLIASLTCKLGIDPDLYPRTFQRDSAIRKNASLA